MFEDDARLHNSLNTFVHNILYNDYNKMLWDTDYINSWDREELSEEFLTAYIGEHEDMQSLSDIEQEKLSIYVAKEIDLLIPKLYFMEVNYELAEKYTPILVRRIYDIGGKDGFDVTNKIKYQFDHDFSQEQERLKEMAASDKQISYLKSLGKNLGYLLWNEEYLTKTYAKQMIEYLSEKTYQEPAIFNFFFVAK